MAKDRERWQQEQIHEGAVRGKSAAWVVFAAAAINNGKPIADVISIADQTVAAFDTRFIQATARGADEEDDDA